MIQRNQDAGSLHARASLDLILDANIEDAGLWFEVAKDMDKTVVPPLAKLHLDGRSCNGLSDIFYIAAVSIKKLVDSQFSDKNSYQAHLTMITLLSDSGLFAEAETHLKHALELMPHDSSLQIRSALMTPAVYNSTEHISSTRALLQQRLDNISSDQSFNLAGLDEFALSPTFYLVYQGYNDASFLTQLQKVYSRGFPAISKYIDARPGYLLGTPSERFSKEGTEQDKRIVRVGFVSSHLRQHSICKLFCGLITGLASHTHIPSNGEDALEFEVFVFSGQDRSKEDAHTSRLRTAVKEFVTVNKFTVISRREVTSRRIDLLIYLDVGMDPSTSVWAASKLAPVQAALWGHPTTTGMPSMDYFISSDLYHLDSHTAIGKATEEAYSEQLVRLPFSALGFVFSLPTLSLPGPTTDSEVQTPEKLISRPVELMNGISALMPNPSRGSDGNDTVSSLAELVELKQSGARLVLVPQHLPKFHPDMDTILSQVLSRVPSARIVITYEPRRTMWRRTLERRWMKEGGFNEEMVRERVLWLQQLSPQQYLGLLTVGDVMLDPFPFGGGVTTLEALAVCTPVVTLPTRQTVPALASGMLRAVFEEYNQHDNSILQSLVFNDTDKFVDNIVTLLTDDAKSTDMRKNVCDNVSKLYDTREIAQQTIAAWGEFITTITKNNFY